MSSRARLCILFSLMAVSISALAADPPERTFIDAAKAGPDYAIQGEYEGSIGGTAIAGLQIVALGNGKFDAVFYAKGLPGSGADKTRVPAHGETKDGVPTFTGEGLSATIRDGVFSGTLDNAELRLKRVERQSPTTGARPPAGAIALFDGKSAAEWATGRIEEV